MNFALSTGAASAFAAGGAGGAVGGLACASAPETISVLTAADIMRVFNIVSLQTSLFSQGKRNFLTVRTTRERGALFREILELRLNHGVRFARCSAFNRASAMTCVARAFQFRCGKFFPLSFHCALMTRASRRADRAASSSTTGRGRPQLKPRRGATRPVRPRLAARAADCSCRSAALATRLVPAATIPQPFLKRTSR